MSEVETNPAILAKMQRAAERAGIKDPADIAQADLSAIYVEHETGRLIGADPVIRKLRKDRPELFKSARDLTEAEFSAELHRRGVRAR